MGQLERYGLYIMVLLIFLICGFAIWGEPPTDVNAKGKGGGVTSMNELDMESQAAPYLGRNKGLRGSQSGPLSAMDKVMSQLPEVGGGSPRRTPLVSDQNIPFAPEAPPIGKGNGPKAQPRPAQAEFKTYVIKPGDILGTIAQKQMGRATYYTKILEANPGLSAKNLPIGNAIKIPVLRAANGGGTRGTVGDGSRFEAPVRYKGKDYIGVAYRVEDGDSMAKIAQKQFSDQKFFHVISGINPGVDPRKLTPGQLIRIPTRDELRR